MHTFPGLGKIAVAVSQVHPWLHAKKCSILIKYATCSTCSLCRVAHPQRCFLNMLFSCLLEIGPFNSAESAKACRRSFEMRYNLFCVFSLVFNTCLWFLFLRSYISHSREERRSWQRCDLITSWGSELLKLDRLLLVPVFWVVAKTGWRKLIQNI